MQIELNKIVNSVDVFRKLSECQLPVKLGFRVLSLTKALDEKLKTFEESRIVLIKKYGSEMENGDIVVQQENMEAFNKDLMDLLSETVEVDVPAIAIDDFPDNVTLNLTDLAKVDWAIK